ncbi:TetR/AcrR family transcriptional regulator [Salinibacterium sp. UTAS2018]|uniref:TetR/AcrR family transcriptional regulator n=1 Tax=Salinibacterium sp. UTAS2018 TaxID=2508880 RepID=UPI00100964F0|nr:TetR/AcrR family transcriptional regulator [Salinibacterium sp. UTAS2018]QAV71417.1 TetR/AcrR family transcriptional regulator [Salinibacterium sp. UTAS2018]
MSATTGTTAGRPRAFDADAVLTQLTDLFWQQGYRHTSLSDIVEASGVHKPSLYRTFGDKEQLFATVLRRYLTEREQHLTGMRATAGPGIAGIHNFFDLFEEFAHTEAGSRGCLAVSASNELRGTAPGFEDFSLEYRDLMIRQMTALAALALPENAPDAALTGQRAELLSTLFLGLQVTIRSQADAAQLHSVFAAVHALVDTWK